MSLRTGVEMISLSMLFNKVAGFYGLLAILTGFHLDVMQLSLYLYSVVALVLLAFLMPHVRKQSPFECLAFSWFYLFDTIINCTYTAAFAFTWFMTISASSSDTHGNVPSSAPGSGTINDTAGFTSPKDNVSEVEVVASPASGLTSGQDAAAIGIAAAASSSTEAISLQHGLQLVESVPSIVVLVLLTFIRIYFVTIVLSYASQAIRQYVMATSSDAEARNPFAPNMSQGQGWRGKLGRIMVRPAKEYFLGGAIEDDWTKRVKSRFNRPTAVIPSERRGISERERRARSGTGPPGPSLELPRVSV